MLQLARIKEVGKSQLAKGIARHRLFLKRENSKTNKMFSQKTSPEN